MEKVTIIKHYRAILFACAVILLAVLLYIASTMSKAPKGFPVADEIQKEPTMRIEEDTATLYQSTYTNSSDDDIVVTSPKPGDVITSPSKVEGIARGPWYFEANAPMVLTDWDGLIIGESYLTASGTWMTNEFVPFEGVLEFESPEFGENGYLILKNANPSGLPEHDKAIEIPIRFK